MQIRNWSKFQHFKDRKPPWVKLYRDILDDLQWHRLDAQAAKTLVMLWLIASEDEGRLPDAETLSFRLRLSEAKTKDMLSALSHWLEPSDINVISRQYQNDTATEQNDSATVDLTLGETERETKKETESKKETKKNAPAVACPPDVDQQTWTDWLTLRRAKKAPVTQTVVDGAKREAGKAGMTLEAFLQVWCRRGSQGLEASWLKPEEKTVNQESFYERDQRLKRERWEEMTGRKWPEDDKTVIDITPTMIEGI
jgi:hypothetical protein